MYHSPKGADGDHLDVYLGPHLASKKVFIVNQVNADTKEWDEHKIMLGFGSLHQALSTYKKAFSDGKGADRIGSIVQTDITHLKEWMLEGNTKKPFTLPK
jgi:Inorganic Pyrophosphatase